MADSLNISCLLYTSAEGYHYTKNINKYTARLFVFAVISHFAYIFASNDFVDATVSYTHLDVYKRQL